MNIIKSIFLTSAQNYKQTINYELGEVAFIGRSNVGKSSLINALANNKNLAKSSSTPGKTQLINFFELTYEDRQKLILIDLPGFGYAKVSKTKKAEWNKNLDDFLRNRKQIKCFLHLIDSRHFNLEIDNVMFEYLSAFLDEQQQYIKVFTKIDKLNQSELAKLKANYKNNLFVSSKNKKGIADLLEKLHEFI